MMPTTNLSQKQQALGHEMIWSIKNRYSLIMLVSIMHTITNIYCHLVSDVTEVQYLDKIISMVHFLQFLRDGICMTGILTG